MTERITDERELMMCPLRDDSSARGARLRRASMTPTSDERRRVAERLRGLDVEITSHDTLERAVDKFTKAVCGDIPFSPIRYSVRNLCGLANMLADLIDPTCHIVCVDDTYNTPETGRVDQWHYECSKCGIELDDNDTDAMDSGSKPFDYCPYCGARVVADGQD